MIRQATLVEFRARVQLHEKMEEAFGRFVDGLLKAGVISADGVQLVDSSAIWGRGAVQDTYNLIGSAVRKLLGVTARRRSRTPEEMAGELGLVLTAPQEGGSLKGRAEIDWSDPEERRALLNELVQEARQVLATASSEDVEADPAVAEAAALLGRILVQDLVPVPSPDGPDDPGDSDTGQAVLELDQEVEIRQGVARDRVVSVGDPEMRHGHKSQNRRWDGYKAHVSVEGGARVHHGVGDHRSQCTRRGGGAVAHRTPEGAGTGAGGHGGGYGLQQGGASTVGRRAGHGDRRPGASRFGPEGLLLEGRL